MNTPLFQVYECTNQECRLRFSTDLSIDRFDNCPKCHANMQKLGLPYSNYESPINTSKPGNSELVLVLDNIRSVLNVGSIFRTADGAGVKHVYCCGTTPTPAHPKIKKTSLGAELLTPWSYHKNAVLLVSHLKSIGKIVIALESISKSGSIFDHSRLTAGKSFALVLGNEISGIDPEILERADEILAIPMTGSKTSLNVAVAAGIGIYALINVDR